MLHHAFDIRRYRFLNVEQRFLSVAALRVASGKRGAAGDYNAAFVFRKGYYEFHFVSRSLLFRHPFTRIYSIIGARAASGKRASTIGVPNRAGAIDRLPCRLISTK